MHINITRKKDNERVTSRAEIINRVTALVKEDSQTSSENEDYQLRRMAQTIRNFEGKFGLIFAISNGKNFQKKFTRRLRFLLPDIPLTELNLDGSENSILDKLLLAPLSPRPLVVFGIENHLLSSEDIYQQNNIIQELQLRREQFKKLDRPLVIWMPEYVYALIGQKATDFWSWQGGGFFFNKKERHQETRILKNNYSSSNGNNLYFTNSEFTGRVPQINLAIDCLKKNRNVIVSGVGGIGKSAFAKEISKRLKDSYPDGVLFIPLRNAGENGSAVVEGLRNAIHFYQPDIQLPHDIVTLTAIYRSILSNKKSLIVVDDVKDTEDIRAFIPRGLSSVLITTRQKIQLPNFTSISLDQLSPRDSRDLLKKIAPGIDKKTSDQIIALCAYMPLTINLVGRLISRDKKINIREYIERLKQEINDKSLTLDTLEQSLSSVIKINISKLNKKSWRLLCKLAVFPKYFDLDAEVFICKNDNPLYLNELVQLGFVKLTESTERYRLPFPVRKYVRPCLSNKAFKSIMKRYSRYYLSMLKKATSLYLSGGRELKRGTKLLDTEWENIKYGQSWVATHPRKNKEIDTLCYSYAIHAEELLELRHHPQELISWFKSGLEAARRLEEDFVIVQLLDKSGRAYASMGEIQQAINKYNEALELLKMSKDFRYAETIYGNLGWTYELQGKIESAVKHYELQLKISRNFENRRVEGSALGNLGRAYAQLGDHKKAISYQEEALKIAREIKNRRAEGAALGNLGRAYSSLGDMELAIEYHNQAIKIVREIGDRRGEGNVLGNLGWIYSKIGQPRQAISYYENSLTIARDIGNQRAEGAALDNLGRAYLQLQDFSSSIDCFEQSLNIDRRINDPNGERASLNNLGEVYLLLGEFSRSIDLFIQSLNIAKQMGNKRAEGNTLRNLGRCYVHIGNLEHGIRLLKESLEIAQGLGNQSVEAKLNLEIEMILQERENEEKMPNYFDEDLRNLAI